MPFNFSMYASVDMCLKRIVCASLDVCTVTNPCSKCDINDTANTVFSLTPVNYLNCNSVAIAL